MGIIGTKVHHEGTVFRNRLEGSQAVGGLGCEPYRADHGCVGELCAVFAAEEAEGEFGCSDHGC